MKNEGRETNDGGIKGVRLPQVRLRDDTYGTSGRKMKEDG